MKRTLVSALFFALASVLFAQQAWQGLVAQGNDADFPGEGLYAASNSFSRNTLVQVSNPKTGKTVRVLITRSLSDPSLLLSISRDAATAIGLSPGDRISVRAQSVSSNLADRSLAEDVPATTTGNSPSTGPEPKTSTSGPSGVAATTQTASAASSAKTDPKSSSTTSQPVTDLSSSSKSVELKSSKAVEVASGEPPSASKVPVDLIHKDANSAVREPAKEENPAKPIQLALAKLDPVPPGKAPPADPEPSGVAAKTADSTPKTALKNQPLQPGRAAVELAQAPFRLVDAGTPPVDANQPQGVAASAPGSSAASTASPDKTAASTQDKAVRIGGVSAAPQVASGNPPDAPGLAAAVPGATTPLKAASDVAVAPVQNPGGIAAAVAATGPGSAARDATPVASVPEIGTDTGSSVPIALATDKPVDTKANLTSPALVQGARTASSGNIVPLTSGSDSRTTASPSIGAGVLNTAAGAQTGLPSTVSSGADGGIASTTGTSSAGSGFSRGVQSLQMGETPSNPNPAAKPSTSGIGQGSKDIASLAGSSGANSAISVSPANGANPAAKSNLGFTQGIQDLGSSDRNRPNPGDIARPEHLFNPIPASTNAPSQSSLPGPKDSPKLATTVPGTSTATGQSLLDKELAMLGDNTRAGLFIASPGSEQDASLPSSNVVPRIAGNAYSLPVAQSPADGKVDASIGAAKAASARNALTSALPSAGSPGNPRIDASLPTSRSGLAVGASQSRLADAVPPKDATLDASASGAKAPGMDTSSTGTSLANAGMPGKAGIDASYGRGVAPDGSNLAADLAEAQAPQKSTVDQGTNATFPGSGDNFSPALADVRAPGSPIADPSLNGAGGTDKGQANSLLAQANPPTRPSLDAPNPYLESPVTTDANSSLAEARVPARPTVDAANATAAHPDGGIDANKLIAAQNPGQASIDASRSRLANPDAGTTNPDVASVQAPARPTIDPANPGSNSPAGTDFNPNLVSALAPAKPTVDAANGTSTAPNSGAPGSDLASAQAPARPIPDSPVSGVTAPSSGDGSSKLSSATTPGQASIDAADGSPLAPNGGNGSSSLVAAQAPNRPTVEGSSSAKAPASGDIAAGSLPSKDPAALKVEGSNSANAPGSTALASSLPSARGPGALTVEAGNPYLEGASSAANSGSGLPIAKIAPGETPQTTPLGVNPGLGLTLNNDVPGVRVANPDASSSSTSGATDLASGANLTSPALAAVSKPESGISSTSPFETRVSLEPADYRPPTVAKPNVTEHIASPALGVDGAKLASAKAPDGTNIDAANGGVAAPNPAGVSSNVALGTPKQPESNKPSVGPQLNPGFPDVGGATLASARNPDNVGIEVTPAGANASGTGSLASNLSTPKTPSSADLGTGAIASPGGSQIANSTTPVPNTGTIGTVNPNNPGNPTNPNNLVHLNPANPASSTVPASSVALITQRQTSQVDASLTGASAILNQSGNTQTNGVVGKTGTDAIVNNPPVSDVAWARSNLPIAPKLEDTSWYLQLGTFGNPHSAKAAIDQANIRVPAVVLVETKSGKEIYRVLIGPVNDDEKGIVLYQVRALGFKDAFVRKGKI